MTVFGCSFTPTTIVLLRGPGGGRGYASPCPRVAMDLLLTGRRMGAEEAERRGPRRGQPGYAHAASARAALESLAGGLAQEWSRHRMPVIALALGNIHTDGLDGYGDDLARHEASAACGAT